MIFQFFLEQSAPIVANIRRIRIDEELCGFQMAQTLVQHFDPRLFLKFQCSQLEQNLVTETF